MSKPSDVGLIAQGSDYDDEHEAFAASRSTDYIYELGSDATFNALDRHTETIEGDSKLPLVITGAAGCGKSALLANWVNRRRQSKHRDEFLFQHFVGCSPRSKQLSHLLFRLETALKEHFQLREMEVPTSEERLRWSLNRFLAAAAKKQFPARIVIILDAVNRLKGESSAADSLHWLPTELPQGVRIIVSTVELEHSATLDDLYDDGSRVHRTYTELRRRKCPTIRLQPLSVEVRHLIIGSFLQANRQALKSLEQAQQFRLVTAKASSQPLFLRTVLYALRLGVEMSDSSIDLQIDKCLSAASSTDLISRVLEMCCEYVELAANPQSGTKVESSKSSSSEKQGHCDIAPPTQIKSIPSNTLAHVLTAIYASRHGLSDMEMWGIVELATSTSLSTRQRDCIRRVLRDFTFSVKGLRNFSHQDYATVVYDKYIQRPDVHIKAHQLLARFFGKLPPCDRKLDALPYHLEVAGNWSRLRAALVDVRMFRLWWTTVHKTEFLNLWASLTTTCTASPNVRKLVTGEFDETMRCKQPLRPCLDIVEEYVRSVDEFKFAQSPSDDELAVVILRIADFMLEFATRSLEEPADVPQFVHPMIPCDDLACLGVPFLSRDKDGSSVLNTPFVEHAGESGSLCGKPSAVDIPMKVNENIPLCSTYFYHRWMWIQFPWVALANCGERFLRGVNQRKRHEQGTSSIEGSSKMTSPELAVEAAVEGKLQSLQHSPISKANGQMTSTSASFSPRDSSGTRQLALDNAKLSPKTKHYNDTCRADGGDLVKRSNSALGHQSINRRRRDLYASLQGPAGEDSTYRWRTELLSKITAYRSELDRLHEEKTNLYRSWQRMSVEARELGKLNISTGDLEAKANVLTGQIDQVSYSHKMAKLVHNNYACVKLMCERHPAHNQALMEELETKIAQDTTFIEEVRQRLRECNFQSHDQLVSNKIVQRASRSMTVLHNEIIVCRIKQRKHIKNMSALDSIGKHTDDTRHKMFRGDKISRFASSNNSEITLTSTNGHQRATRVLENAGVSTANSSSDATELSRSWEDHADLIRKRTFITDIREFFNKFYNALALQAQMSSFHEAAELRQRDLKNALSSVETELEQVRYDSQSIVGSGSREARELQTRLAGQLTRHKHACESASAAERLRQAAFGGIKHVCTTLGIPPPDHDTPVNEIIHQVESVLEALMEERDKNAQKIGDAHQPPFRDAAHGYEKLARAPELEAALEQFEAPKALIAPRLPAKSTADEPRLFLESDEMGGMVDDGVKCRSDVKREALRNLRAEQRRLARLTSQ